MSTYEERALLQRLIADMTKVSRSHSHTVITDAESAAAAAAEAAAAAAARDKTLRRIKGVVRASSENVRAAHELLREQLRSRSATARRLALELADTLFNRSKLFRDLTMPHLRDVVTLTIMAGVGVCADFGQGASTTGRHSRASAPAAAADTAAAKAARGEFPCRGSVAALRALRAGALEAITRWHARYREHYPQLRNTVTYLRDVLHIHLPTAQEAEAAVSTASTRARSHEAAGAGAGMGQPSGRAAERAALADVETAKSHLRQLEAVLLMLRPRSSHADESARAVESESAGTGTGTGTGRGTGSSEIKEKSGAGGSDDNDNDIDIEADGAKSNDDADEDDDFEWEEVPMDQPVQQEQEQEREQKQEQKREETQESRSGEDSADDTSLQTFQAATSVSKQVLVDALRDCAHLVVNCDRRLATALLNLGTASTAIDTNGNATGRTRQSTAAATTAAAKAAIYDIRARIAEVLESCGSFGVAPHRANPAGIKRKWGDSG